MAFNKTINLLIFDGNPNGMMMCELSNWNGCIYKIPRTELSKFAQRNDAKSTGVYFLFGINELGDNTIYIGEAESMTDRLRQHTNDEDDWNECIAVISKDDLLNKAHVKYMENCFYIAAKEIGQYLIVNGNTPTKSSISEYDEAMIEEFMSHTKLLVSTLGYKAFESTEELRVKDTNLGETFFIRSGRGADAKGFLSPEGFVVLEGSIAADTITASMSQNLIKARERLYAKGIINSDNIFVRDHLFTSPSLAAAVVTGMNANGRKLWKNAQKISIKKLESMAQQV